MMFNGGATFGKFGQKHVLNKYGRPIIQNRNMALGKGKHNARQSGLVPYEPSNTTRGHSSSDFHNVSN